MRKRTAWALAFLLALAPAAFAQISVGGNIYGTITDESGAVLPGVSITVTGETGTRTAVTGPQGAFRFLSLDRGPLHGGGEPDGLQHGVARGAGHHG